MDTKEEFDDEHLFKKIEQHNRNVNVAVSLTIVATTLIGVMAMRNYLMTANAQEAKSEFELKYEDDVRRFNLRSSKEPHFNKLGYKKESKKTEYTSGHFNDATKQNFRQDRYAGLQVDINTADTAELRKLPGIGEKRAMNIVKYRTSLGGFYTVEQLAEVYSIDAELVERLKKYIVCDGNSVAKIDINNIIPYQLWHPYLKGELLKTIKQRIKNGKRYKSFDEIKAENGYDENLNGRAEKYLEFK